MKVILKSKVKGLGEAGQIVQVADGYARNFLIPRGLASVASEGALKDLQQQADRQAAREQKLLQQAQRVAAKLDGQVITLSARAGEAGKLFGSVTPADVAEAIQRQLGVEIDRHKFVHPEPIKTLGRHRFQVKLHHGVTAAFEVEVREAAR